MIIKYSIVELSCDRCGEIIRKDFTSRSASVKEVVAYARHEGWKVNRKNDIRGMSI